MDQRDLCTLDRDDAGDGWVITFTRRLPHPVEKVWRPSPSRNTWPLVDRLASHLDGAEARDWGERWQEVHPAYVDAFGPEAATVGPRG